MLKGSSCNAADVLEALLLAADPAVTHRQTAELALKTFGSVGAVLAADPKKLSTSLRLDARVVSALKAIRRGMEWALLEHLQERPLIDSLAELARYLAFNSRTDRAEVVRLLLLDQGNRLMKDEEIAQDPSQNHRALRRITVKKTLELSAAAVIIVRGCPVGARVRPYVEATLARTIQDDLRALGFPLHDFLIVRGKEVVSLRRLAIL